MVDTITVQTIDAVTGIAPTYQPITAGGDTATLTTRTFLQFFSVSDDKTDITIDGTPDINVTMDEGNVTTQELFIGPFDVANYGPVLTVSYDLNGGAAADIMVVALMFSEISYTPSHLIMLSGGMFDPYKVLDGGTF